MQRDVLVVDRYTIATRANIVAEKIDAEFRNAIDPVDVYGIPRGGAHAAHWVVEALCRRSSMYQITYNSEHADVFVDDLIDSGKTQQRYWQRYPKTPFFALFDKRLNPEDRKWLIFPWEGSEEASIEDATIRLLQYIGEDPNRDGLRETPARVARAWRDWTSGYNQDPKEVLKTFEAPNGRPHDAMVLLRNLPFYSHCEHHLAPFFGTADIAYIPGAAGRIVGVSKLARLLELYARRLQVQERLTEQVAQALMDGLDAKGAAVQVRARHLCMESRGVHKQGQEMVTQALRGVFFDDARTRAEFMGMVK